MPRKNDSRAIIIGGGFAGLLAAAVASRYFDNVIIVEPDVGIDSDQPRQFVPQGRQPHALLQAGQNILQEMFPHFDLDSWETGTCAVRETLEADIYLLNRKVEKFEADYKHVIVNRARFEYCIRQQVNKLHNVSTKKGYRLKDLVASKDGKGISSIVIETLGANKLAETLEGDLFIDATGRNSNTPLQLSKLGFGSVEINQVKSDIRDISRVYEFKEGSERDWKFMNIASMAPESRYGFIFPISTTQFIVLVGGCAGNYPEAEDAAYLQFMKDLPVPELYDFVSKNGIPVSPLYKYDMPYTLFRRYDTMETWPAHFLAIGDSIHVINPIYGQGMSVIALCMKVLDNTLKELSSLSKTGDLPYGSFEHAYQKQIAQEIIEPIWGMVSTEDLMHPQVEGKRHGDLKFEHWYSTEFLKTAHENVGMMKEFFEVTHLLRSPDDLMRPEFFFRVLKGWIDRKFSGESE